MKGLLGQPEYATGLLGAATANPNMARQFANARQSMAAPTSIMDERYPAWKKSQDQAEQFLLAADFISSAIPAAVMAAPYAKKGLLAAGKTLAPKVENYMARTGLLQPATVWHGSPHRFDKFDASKIGTGEGAQAYGHGLYLAENPTVAKQYQNMVRAEVNGKPFAPSPFDPEFGALDALHKAKNDYGRAKQILLEKEAKYGVPVSLAPEVTALEKMQQQGVKANLGNLYKVDLPDEAIAKMLDWDKPLSQQPESVRTAVIKAAKESGDPWISGWAKTWEQYPSVTGEEVMRSLSQRLSGQNTQALRAGTVPQASEMVNKAGIPGIRYLDGGSRGAGAGTSNYVVFPGNESLLKILSRE